MYKVNNINEIENNEINRYESMVLDQYSFYPPEDDRFYTSGVQDIIGGDTFVGYTEYFWETYGWEIYDDFEM